MFGLHLWKRTDDFSRELLKNTDSLYSTAMRLTRNPADAEDLVQETFLKAYRAKDSFESGSNLRAWLFKILHNTFINDYHHRQREKNRFDTSADFSDMEERLADQWSESNYGLQRLPFSDEMSMEVRQALEDLPSQFRVVVELIDLQDFSYAEAAEIIGHPIGTVMSRLARGRKMLQSALQEYAIQEGILKQRPAEAVEARVTPLSAANGSRKGMNRP